MMNIDDIVASFKKAYPDDTILFYKFKSGGASSYYGERLLKVKLEDGYFLQIIKLLKSSGELMNSDDIKTKVFPFVYESKNEINDIQRCDTLREKLKIYFQSITLMCSSLMTVIGVVMATTQKAVLILPKNMDLR